LADGGEYEGKATVGSKVIAVPGSLSARGKSKAISWSKLKATAHAGSHTIIVNGVLNNWSYGDEIVLSPTSYFDETGTAWNKLTKNNVETLIINSLSFDVVNQVTAIALNSSLAHTHVCEKIYVNCFVVQLVCLLVLFDSFLQIL
jgi:hypothetical protein